MSHPMFDWSSIPDDEWPTDDWLSDEWPPDEFRVAISVVDPRAHKLMTELRKLAVDAAKLAALVDACAVAARPRPNTGPHA